MDCKWRFPSNYGAQIYGISDTGIETFRNVPLDSLAREICQNSLDAHIDNSDKPVIVEFKMSDLSINNIPDIEGLNQYFKKAEKFWTNDDDPNAYEFYKVARKQIQSGKCTVLRISDYNTKGLEGCGKDLPRGKPWIHLVKSSGVSNKPGTSGGSFGIGKYASYACSYFHTVIYSTNAIDGNSAYQGVTRLSSVELDDKTITTGIGYYGSENNNPVFGKQYEPSLRKKDEYGTDIYILGFIVQQDWEEQIITAILDSFLYAIYKGTLVAKVGKIEINAKTLQDIVTQYCSSKKSILNYYKVLVSPETKVFEKNYNNMGVVKLRLLLSDELHSKVSMIRATGMRIMEQGRITGQISFAGILSIEGVEINDYLRHLENPEHTKWEINRAKLGHKEEAKTIVSGLVKYIRDCLDELVEKDDSKNEIDPGIGDYLPSMEQDEGKKEMKDTISDVQEKITLKRNKVISSELKSDENGETSDSEENGSGNDFGSGGKDKNSEGRGSSGNGYGSGSNGVGNNNGELDGEFNGKEKNNTINPISCRIFPVDKSKGIYKLIFVPSIDCDNASLKIFQAAETDYYPAEIQEYSVKDQPNVNYSQDTFQGISLRKENKLHLTFTINSNDYSSFEVKCYENKK